MDGCLTSLLPLTAVLVALAAIGAWIAMIVLITMAASSSATILFLMRRRKQVGRSSTLAFIMAYIRVCMPLSNSWCW